MPLTDKLEIELLNVDYDDILSFRHTLSSEAVPFQQLANIRKADGAAGGTTYLPHLTALAPYGAGLIAAIGAWFAGKNSRRLRLKIGDLEVEATSVEEVERLLALARAARDAEDS